MGQFISSPSRTLDILKSNNIRLSKSLGQNYLIDTNIAKKIVDFSGIDTSENILEIGSGIGSLTELIIPRCKKVVCIEIDKKISLIFKELFSDLLGKKIELIEEDALKMDYERLLGEYEIDKIVSNLPYKIAAPLVIKLLKASENVKSFYFTIQKDIADRMTASPGDKNYNAYSVKMRALSVVDTLFKVSSNCFYPKPHVDSSFIKIIKDKSILSEDFIEKKDTLKFFGFIEHCFRHRRKKLLSSLKEYNITHVDKKRSESKILSDIGKNIDIRPEELSVQDFIELYKRITGII